MTLTPFQSELVKELQRVSINTKYPGNFTLDIKSFLKEIVDARKKVEKNCCCSRCKYLKMFS